MLRVAFQRIAFAYCKDERWVLCHPRLTLTISSFTTSLVPCQGFERRKSQADDRCLRYFTSDSTLVKRTDALLRSDQSIFRAYSIVSFDLVCRQWNSAVDCLQMLLQMAGWVVIRFPDVSLPQQPFFHVPVVGLIQQYVRQHSMEYISTNQNRAALSSKSFSSWMMMILFAKILEKIREEKCFISFWRHLGSMFLVHLFSAPLYPTIRSE